MNSTSVHISTAQAAKQIGVSKSTLLRWIWTGVVEDVEKDRRGWRRFYPADIDRLRGFNEGNEARESGAA